MSSKNPVVDSPKGWVNRHIKEYVKSDGKKGHRWYGYPTLLLTTRGRKTGELRRTALIYGQDKGRYLVVASNGGAVKHPLWYLNLLETPEVEVQVGAETFMTRARPANAREKPRLWRLMNEIYPTYEKYQERAAKADRVIPVVILEPIA
jgi:deazaflavin-dependent oxidoreductase (nitroreductase family)